jgi:hypothetical protein
MSDNYIDPEIKVIELWDGSLWVERPGWACTFGGGEDGEDMELPLGVLFRIRDAVDEGIISHNSPEAGRPWVVESVILPQPEGLTARAREVMGARPEDCREEVIYHMADYFGGVPVDTQSINPANSEPERIPGLKLPAGIEMPLFPTKDEAVAFCREKVGVLDAVMGLIGFYLDRPVNRMGESGWEYLRQIVAGRW